MERRKISVTTIPNGYSVEIDGKGYLYFDMETLLAGCLYHILTKNREVVDTDFAMNIMEAAATWPKVSDAIKANATLMKEKKKAISDRKKCYDQNRILTDKIERLQKKINKQQEQLDEYHDKIADLLLLTKCQKHKDIK